MIEKIFKAVMPIASVCMIILVVQIHRLPDEISEAVAAAQFGKRDTILKEKVVTITPPNKSGICYINGELTGQSLLIKDNWAYNSDLPVEFFDGYLTTIRGNDKGKYFLWSRNKIAIPENQRLTMEGWFVPIPCGKFGTYDEKDEWINVVVPIVEKKNWSLP